MIQKLLKEVPEGFNVIDIGCSGALNPKWKPIESSINLSGFDPNEEECKRLASLSHNFRSVKYHPYAVAGHNGSATLYKTKSIYCYSLLKPDTEWLRRFAFHDLLEVIGEEQLEVVKLNAIKEFQELDIDAIKIDAQGLELEILNAADELLDNVIYAETESGFTSNYINESTQSQVNEFMRSKGFLLFDLIPTRMTHNNIFKDTNVHRALLLWSESIWLRDYLRLYKENKLLPGKNINRVKALKILIICALQECVDYGFELAKIFCEIGLIDKAELDGLKNINAWKLEDDTVENPVENQDYSQSKILNFMLRLLPGSTRKLISKEASIAVNQKHILKLG